MALTFEFKLDPAETVRASRVVARRRPFGRIEPYTVPAFVAFGLFFVAVGVPWQSLWLLWAVVVGLLLLQFIMPIVQRRQLRRLYDETPSLRSPQTYEFTDTGIVTSGGATSTTVGWDSLVEVIETDEFFLFYHTKRTAFYLPKRVVTEEEQRAALRQLLRTHLGDRARGL